MTIKEKYRDNWYDVTLIDDKTHYGGISYIGETLGEFIEEMNNDGAHYSGKTSLKIINKALSECGIALL